MTAVRKSKKIWVACASVVVIICILLGLMLKNMRGADDDTGYQMIPESTHIKDSDVEECTLIIGGYLIYYSALTDELYDIAEDSASTFNQTNIYYKSEFSNGAWYEISSANKIEDISTEGTPVDVSVIENLDLRYHTKSDGVTYDLLTGEAVNIFNTSDPYSLSDMEELEPLITQYQIMLQKDNSTDEEEAYKDLVRKFFANDIKSIDLLTLPYNAEDLESYSEALEITSDDVNRFDSALDGLNNYYNEMGTDNIGARNIVSSEMGKIDAEREIYIMARVGVLLANLTTDCSNVTVGDEDDDDATAAATNSDLIEAIAESIENVETTYSESIGNGFIDATSAVTRKERSIEDTLIDDSVSNDSEKIAADIDQLVLVDDIKNNDTSGGEEELDLIKSNILPDAVDTYKSGLKAGTSDDYKDAKKNGMNDSVLEQYLEQSKTSLNADRMECESLIFLAVKIMENSEGQAFVRDKLDEADTLKNVIASDAMQSKAEETVNQYIDDLTSKYSELVNNSKDSSAINDLQSQREDLLNQKNQALADDDLQKATLLSSLISDLDSQIEDLQKDYLNTLSSDTASSADKAIASANIAAGTAGSLAMEMANDCISDIESGNTDTVLTTIDALSALLDKAPEAATGALNNLKDAMDLSSAVTDEMNSAVNSAIDDGNEKISQIGNLSSDDILSLLSQLLGSGFEGLSDEDKASAVVAIDQYGEITANTTALKLAGSLADSLSVAGNKYVYDKYTGSYNEFVSVKTISDCMSYRYVFDDSHLTVTLTKRGNYYVFENASTTVTKKDGETEELTENVVYQKYLYIPKAYVESEFSGYAEYINESSVAVFYNETQKETITNIYNALIAKGGN